MGVENIVDLTHTLTPNFPYIPVPGITFPFRAVPIATIDQLGVAANRWEIHEHIGTQIDAPNHFVPNGISLESIPVESLIAPLAVIDVSDRALRDPDTRVTVADLLAWERRHGRLPRGAAVFMNSGWGSRVGNPSAFINADSGGAIESGGKTAASEPTMHFPGFSPEAAEFLARERDVVGIGVDVLSLDPGEDKKYQAHKVWLRAGKWGVECVANLDQVPPWGAIVFVGGTKVEGATGGPVRLIATYPTHAREAVERETSVNRLAGTWRSPAAENLGGGMYGTREFRFTKDRWQVEAHLYLDHDLQEPVCSFAAEGAYRLEEGSPDVIGARNGVFSFDRKSLMLLTADSTVIERFGFQACDLQPGVRMDISSSGCSFFTSIAACGQEYDLVRIDGNTLRLGARPADRNLCVPEKRPRALGMAVERVKVTPGGPPPPSRPAE